jgi:hypothetical protein
VKKIIVAVAAGGVLLTGCGGSSSGGDYSQQQAPTNRNYTTVDVNGLTVDVTQTTIYGYTCLVGLESNYYHDYSPTIWCDPNSKKATP